jgi:hypothetical protein
MHSSMSGPNFVHGPLSNRQNGGVLVAEENENDKSLKLGHLTDMISARSALRLSQ